jgi:hypothetical protein
LKVLAVAPEVVAQRLGASFFAVPAR